MMYGAQPDMDVKNLTQPILECFRATGETPAKKSKGEKPETVSIVPELALLTGLTDDLRTNFSNMNKILDSVRKKPGKRDEVCGLFALGLSNHPKAKEKMAAWAMTMDANLLDLEGRELPTVHLAQAGNKTAAYDRVDADGTRNLRGNKLDEAGVMNNITVFYSQPDKNKAGDFHTMLGEVGAPMGMKFVTPKEAVEETQLFFSLHHSAVTVYPVEERGQQVGHEHRHQAGHANERQTRVLCGISRTRRSRDQVWR
ncbi:hypothetical protein RvY_15484-2 [Ramazzottius varieornatus]|uniref:Uncharacterized protein n=1 Tax=Ramazzottius varieornatus TaxID=947166 RepID=A0A1D1W1W4_RAMVA|nr:hypothetical protein RvY_15484-2 [Ramazzottius varieornatus]